MSVFDRDDFLFYWSPGSGWTAPVGGPPTFSRASVAHRVNRAGVLEEIEADYPRRHWGQDENGLWRPMAKLEASRTNELHNSTSPATQTRSLTAGTYTLWIEGTGSVDADGATDGAYGTATEGQANDLTFTVSATQNVTFTVNGSVTRFQCELGSFRSSFITTAGAAVTRSADSLSYDISGTPLATPQEMTVYVKFVERGAALMPSVDPGVFAVGNRFDGSQYAFGIQGSRNAGVSGYQPWRDDGTFKDAGGGTTFITPDIGQVVEVRCVLDPSSSEVRAAQALDGGLEGSVLTVASGTIGNSFQSDEVLINTRDSGGDKTGFNDFISLKVASGVRTMDEMRALAGTG